MEYSKKRLLSMCIDYGVMIILFLIFHLPFSIYYEIQHPEIIGEEYIASDPPILDFLAVIIFAISLNKDFYHGRSIGKYLLGFQLLNFQTKEVASPLRCFIRNLTIFIWPIETLFAIFKPHRRIGDILAGTELDEYGTRASNKLNWSQVIISVALSLFLASLLVYIFQFI